MLLEQFALPLGGWIIVLDAKESGSATRLRLRSRVAEHRQDERVGACMQWGNIRQPAVVGWVLQTRDKLIDRRNVRIEAVLVLTASKGFVCHTSSHGGAYNG